MFKKNYSIMSPHTVSFHRDLRISVFTRAEKAVVLLLLMHMPLR